MTPTDPIGGGGTGGNTLFVRRVSRASEVKTRGPQAIESDGTIRGASANNAQEPDSVQTSPRETEEIDLSGISPDKARELQDIIISQGWGKPPLNDIPQMLKGLQTALENVAFGKTIQPESVDFEIQAYALQHAGTSIYSSVEVLRNRPPVNFMPQLTDDILYPLFAPLIRRAKEIETDLHSSKSQSGLKTELPPRQR